MAEDWHAATQSLFSFEDPPLAMQKVRNSGKHITDRMYPGSCRVTRVHIRLAWRVAILRHLATYTREREIRKGEILSFASHPFHLSAALPHICLSPMMESTPTVFITRATGSQGGSLCYELRKLGWNVRATTRDLGSPAARALQAAGVNLILGSWDDEDALRKGLDGCNKLFLCLLPNLADFEQAPRRAALIARLAQEAGVNHAIASTTLGSFMVEPGYVPPVKLGPFFDAHIRSKKRVEQAVIDGGFVHWTVLRPGFFMANFIEPKIQFGYAETREGSWTNSLTAESPLGLVDHVDIARFAAAAFQDPNTYHGRKLGVISEELRVQNAMDELAEEIGDGRSIKAVFMTDEEIAQEQAKGSWLFFSSEPCVRYLENYTDLEELRRLLPGLMTFKNFLLREKEAVKETYLSSN